jgi:hypothetical protein
MLLRVFQRKYVGGEGQRIPFNERNGDGSNPRVAHVFGLSRS